VRWPSILFGILTLLLVYQLGLKLFQHPVLPLLAFGIALLTPALYHWSRLAVDGIFAVPFVLAAMLNVHLFLESQRSRHLWLTGLLLGIGFYSSTTAPIQMPIYLALFAVTLWIAGYKHAAVYGRLAAGFIAPLLLLVPWFALHPETYRDTLGRWAIHAAHVRNPLDGLRAMVNWGSLTNRASVYWEFLNPAFLFFPAESPDALRTTASGPLLATLMPLLLTGVVRVFRANSPALPLLVGGYFLAPLAAATFGEDHALERVLVMFPIAALLATFGVETMWGSRSKASQLTAALLLLLAALQFAFFLR
jgi:4-amino-4-deoxy-L-arabinose transferase-like glycosyltransferase